MQTLHLAATALGLCLVAGGPALAQTSAPQAATPPNAAMASTTSVDPAALAALKRMSAYLQTLPAVQLTSNSSLDVVTQEGQRVQLDGVVDYKIKKPNAFVIDMNSDQKKRRFYYDGKQFTVYGPTMGYYATADAPPTIRETLAAIDAKYGIELPLEDLFRWNDPTGNPAENLISGFPVGTATIDGVETEHYAFRQKDVDWQIWIQKGAPPLPRKVVIVDRTDEAHPTYTARLSWNVNPNFAPDEFAFRPAKDAKQIRLSELSN